MRLLVLGGTHHVGRALVEAALQRGDEVTTVTRGVSGPSADGAHAVHVDRTDQAALADALGVTGWDVAIDTWSGAARVVHDSAELLVDRVEHYVYVSSRSVYVWPLPLGSDESAPVVEADPLSDDGSDYAAAKRGAEIAVEQVLGQRAMVARAGLILGPYEIVGRLPWWLGRISRGGRVLAPGPRELPLQYVDGRDLADWLLSAGERRVSGAFNAVSPPGHTTMGELLDTCLEVTGADADLVWTSPETIAAAGVSGWTELPIWVPPTGDLAGLHAADTAAAHREGLTCRPVLDTVRGTWEWLQKEGFPEPPAQRGAPGLDPQKEQEILATL
jgi:2'-hydroxyisoflavone reductase